MIEIRLRHARAAPLLTVMLMAAMGTANAYTPEQQQACSGDAFRLCSSDIPDVDRVTACMVRNKSQLSPECRAQFGPDPRKTVADTPAGRPIGIRPAKSKKPKANLHKTTTSAKS